MALPIWILAVALMLLVAAYVAHRQMRKPARPTENLDTVAAWPPTATRVLGSRARALHRAISAALPECIVLGQVPMARFIAVPRRQSYGEWLRRVGHLRPDLVVCDANAQVIAAILLPAERGSERSQARRQRMLRVLEAAGIRAVVWDDAAIPGARALREMLLPASAGVTPQASGEAVRTAGEPVVDEDEGAREPPPSTWFDDIESTPMPFDPSKGGAAPPSSVSREAPARTRAP